MIVKIEDNKVYKTSLAPSLNKDDFLFSNKDYIEIDFDLDPEKRYKLDINNNVVEDVEETLKYNIDKNKIKASEIIRKTNKYLIEDSDDTESGITKSELLELRKQLKNIINSDEFIEFPLIKEELKL